MKAISQNSANASLGKRQTKGKQFESQIKRVFESFFKHPKTMLMVEAETAISRSSICRRVAQLRKNNSIEIVRVGVCPISKHPRVQHLTTNPKLFPQSDQLTLF